MDELWKNFGKHYKVSNSGKVYSEASKRLLKLTQNKDGYLKTSLILENGSRKTYSVHVLVGILFIANPENLPEINHLDGDKENNWYWNLEWSTHSNNIQHAWDTGLMYHSEQGKENIRKAAKKLMTENNPRQRKVKCVTTGEIFNSMSLAEDWCGLSKSSISRYLTTPSRKSCGKHPETREKLTWEYI